MGYLEQNFKKIDLPIKTLKQIINVAIANYQVDKIIIFGSRSNHNSSQTSDIDIAIKANQAPDGLKSLLDEKIPSLLNFDVIYYNNINDALKKEIKKNGVLIYEKTESDS